MNLTSEQDLRVNLNQESVLRRIVNRIRRSLELEEILSATAAEVRSLLGTDRVKIYKFHPDSSGQVIAESINDNRLPSLLGLNFPADDIPPHARELFIKSRVRSVVNVDAQQIGQSFLSGLETGEILSEEIRYRPVDPCHVTYLTAMGVESSLVAPILHHDKLWGLLVSHHSEPRSIPESELEIVQMVVDQLSVAIAQSTLLTQAREKAQREAIINHITTLLHSLPTIDLQQALEATIAAFQGCGGRLCIKAEALNLQNGAIRSLDECLKAGSDCVKVYTCGKQPVIPELTRYRLMEQYSVWREHYKSGEYDIWAIADIYQTPSLRNLQSAFGATKIRSILMVPLQYHQQVLGYLSIFRDEVETETLWAGHRDSDRRQLYPRISFEVWREFKKSQPRAWTVNEIELAQGLSKPFVTAIHQHALYQQVHALNTNLENQVQERTAKLQQAAKQQQILFEVVAKVRESLDLDTIFATTAREVRYALNADRVAVFRFDPDLELSAGKVVAEDVLPGFTSSLSVEIHDPCFKNKYAALYYQGRIHSIADIHNAGLTDCYVEQMNRFQIQAHLVVPLVKGGSLWGLLCIHQCSQTRDWETSEIQFVTQVAAQLSVALQQADLLARTRHQAERLSQALRDLQKTQTQLIQTEKMSSLGQLVAGVAHEINNPVNFIYGNLTHVSEYAEDLIKLLELYQQHCPNPTPEIRDRAEDVDLGFIAQDLPKILSSMNMGVDRIRQLVLSLRNFSRLDEAAMKPVNIHEGIDSTLLILQHRLKANSNLHSIEIVKNYGNLPLVECYAGQLNQVFMNVLSNAIDALEHHSQCVSEPHASRITISTAVSEFGDYIPSVVIRIADNGPGMLETVSARVFDPFFTTKPVGKGTGLGLSISYQIVVDRHGGIFKCTSHLGQGTEFWIEIPVRQPDCEPDPILDFRHNDSSPINQISPYNAAS